MTKRAAPHIAAVVVHDLNQAVSALEAAAALGQPIALWSAAGAGIYAGPGWFAAVERRARAAVPSARATFILDCAQRPDVALAAFREGIREVRFSGGTALAERLADIASKWHATLHRRRPKALDLLDEADPAGACRRHLGGD